MRFCPFCSAENADESTHCVTCARKLPPLPPRRRNTTGSATAIDPALLGLSREVAAASGEELVDADAPAGTEGDRAAAPAGKAKSDSLLSRVVTRGAPPAPLRSQREVPGFERRRPERGDQTPIPAPLPRPDTPPPARKVPPPAAAPTGSLAKRHASPTARHLGSPSGQQPAQPAAAAETASAASAPAASAPAAAPAQPAPGSSAPPTDAAEWPGPKAPPAEPHPDDWGADAARVADAARAARADADADAAGADADVAAPAGVGPAAAARSAADDPPVRPSRPSGKLDLPTPRREPPPTRVNTSGTRGLKPPDVQPVPDVPEPGLFNSVQYALLFMRARWQRRSAIKTLNESILEDTEALDQVLGTLGKQARTLKVDSRVLAAENDAIDDAEARRRRIEQELAQVAQRQGEENNKFAEIEAEWRAKIDESEGALDKAQSELGALEAQRRSLRDKRKAIERQQKGYLKSAEERDEQASKASMGDARAGLRRLAEDLRRDAAALDPERQDLERRLAALEAPMSKSAAKVESLKAELDNNRRSLTDASEGHRHRLTEIEAEQGRKTRDLSQAEAEIQRRMVTLGTMVNLHRIERPEFEALYERIDGLRSAIGTRSTQIDRLTAERDAYDRASLLRGFVWLGVGVVALVTLIVVLFALL